MIKIKLLKYNRFVEIRLMRYADKGIMTALAKAKPLVTHCPVAKDTFKSITTFGNATTIAVANKVDENDVIIKFKNINVFLRSDIYYNPFI